jgi:mannose-6-phosphate isomerase-like protein (cupin superfamily)
MTTRGETWTRERCYITELVNEDAIGAFSLAMARVEPGVTTERHRLSVDEWYVIRSGQGRMEVGDEAPRPVTEGDIVAVGKGVAQRITNTGDEDLVFDCICLPRFTPDAYEPLEED